MTPQNYVTNSDIIALLAQRVKEYTAATIDKVIAAAHTYPQYAAAARVPEECIPKIEAEIHSCLYNIG